MYFFESIPLQQDMLPTEAIDTLAHFHNATAEAIINAFTHLRNFTDWTVSFAESVNNGNPCIAMRGKPTDGSHGWFSLINKHTGQPQAHCA